MRQHLEAVGGRRRQVAGDAVGVHRLADVNHLFGGQFKVIELLAAIAIDLEIHKPRREPRIVIVTRHRGDIRYNSFADRNRDRSSIIVPATTNPH